MNWKIITVLDYKIRIIFVQILLLQELVQEVTCSHLEEYGINFTQNFNRGQPSPDWESLVFWIPNGVSLYGLLCRNRSRYYCLDAYFTQQGSNFGSTSRLDGEASKAWFRIIIKQHYSKINMINFVNPTGCCDSQVRKYEKYGLQFQNIQPDDYLAKLMDYNEDGKTLNYVSAVYASKLCMNMLMDIGFGPGQLRRDHHVTVVEGAPYVLVGRGFGDLGLPEIDSVTFDYWNISSQLTFHWFKHEIMCKGSPWICGDTDEEMSKLYEKGESSASRQNDKKESKKASGSKKNRRKNKSRAFRRRLIG
ncbi:uncharacterized protein LOC142350756 [Convolutriloba macropyga]|uniref:uncharacterized protein LOC142350756 n=1 Tax=Convolutriloba macropyga TaxID=536237 RepID=UPI003F525748